MRFERKQLLNILTLTARYETIMVVARVLTVFLTLKSL
jgi:hypothetical protein